MEQYINKSALVAEIERRRNICKKVVLDLRTEENKDYYQGKAEAYKETLDFLNTLEVREVDLNKEIEKYLRTFSSSPDNGIEYSKKLAKHFFELGMQQSKNDNNNG